jgi:hypothetical protein
MRSLRCGIIAACSLLLLCVSVMSQADGWTFSYTESREVLYGTSPGMAQVYVNAGGGHSEAALQYGGYRGAFGEFVIIVTKTGNPPPAVVAGFTILLGNTQNQMPYADGSATIPGFVSDSAYGGSYQEVDSGDDVTLTIGGTFDDATCNVGVTLEAGYGNSSASIYLDFVD